MTLFSERIGMKARRTSIQLHGMDEPLRNRLWNTIHPYLFSNPDARFPDLEFLQLDMIRRIWSEHFKWPVDELSDDRRAVSSELKRWFKTAKWFEVYDLTQYVSTLGDIASRKHFVRLINSVLEQELSGYRFIGMQLCPIAAESEIQALEESILKPASATAGQALGASLERLSHRDDPDYDEAISEAIRAVEAVCKLITGRERPTIADALARIERSHSVKLPQRLKVAVESLFAYSSDADGLRHAYSDVAHTTQEDAVFMLFTCSALVSFLKAKWERGN